MAYAVCDLDDIPMPAAAVEPEASVLCPVTDRWTVDSLQVAVGDQIAMDRWRRLTQQEWNRPIVRHSLDWFMPRSSAVGRPACRVRSECSGRGFQVAPVVFAILGQHQFQRSAEPCDPRAADGGGGLADPYCDDDGRGRAGALQAGET